MKNINITNIDNVRIGKHITMTIEAKDENEAKASAEKACKELLYNPIMESFEINIIK